MAGKKLRYVIDVDYICNSDGLSLLLIILRGFRLVNICIRYIFRINAASVYAICVCIEKSLMMTMLLLFFAALYFQLRMIWKFFVGYGIKV